MYAMSVIHSPYRAKHHGRFGIVDVDPAFVGQQIDAVFADIPPDAVKIAWFPTAAP
jgi:hydroxymethylpyrimidine/phosphomethylpyrimidine kinase